MLPDHHQRRKRGRSSTGPAAARAPASVRRPPSAPSQPPPPPAPRAASTRILAALPRFPETQRAPPPVPLWTRRAGAFVVNDADDAVSLPVDDAASLPADDATGDVQRLVRHAHRARALLLDRLAVVSLRRSHRCALAEELARLKKVLAVTQAQVDASTRNIATMDRLVLHLQTISSIFDAGVTQQRSGSGEDAIIAGDEDEEKLEAAVQLISGDTSASPTEAAAAAAAPSVHGTDGRHKRRSDVLEDDDPDNKSQPPTESESVPSENEHLNAPPPRRCEMPVAVAVTRCI